MDTTITEDTHRLLHLMVRLEAGATGTRADLAKAMNITPRAVSFLLVRARTRFGVTIVHTEQGYGLASPGVFDMTAVRKFLRVNPKSPRVDL
jgi:hypothetical protein